MSYRRIGLAAAFLLSCNCKGTNTQRASQHPDATVTSARDAAMRGEAAAEAPANLLMTMRGESIRRALPLLFPEAVGPEVIEQLSRQLTPGVADHGDEIDADGPYAVAGTITGAQQSTLTLYVAWPLRPGMQIAQDAQREQGWRRTGEGLYRPTTRDAGADAENQCWIARRRPSGWMMLCGPSENLERVAGYLLRTVNAQDNTAVIDLDVRAGLVGELAERQLRELDQQAPPRADGGIEGLRRAMFDEARRSAALFTSIATDVERFRGTITQDADAMHLRAEMDLSRASNDTTRALVNASAGRTVPEALLRSLPDRVRSWVVGGFERATIERALGGAQTDPNVAMQTGPELARVLTAVESLKGLLPLGERVEAYSEEDGYTMYHVIRRPDAAQFVNDLRVAINSIPNTRTPDGRSLRDAFAVMPTPGLTGEQYLRVGQRVTIPPGVQVPPEVREALERSMLVVAEGDRVIAVMARDPVARYRAMSEGARLGATVPQGAVLAGHVTAGGFTPIFYGGRIPQLGPAHTTEPLEFSLSVERRGEGAHVALQADAPIATALEIRTIYAMIQALREQMMRAAIEQQRAAQQGHGTPGGMPRPRPQTPRLDPSMLPPPPNVQLQPPR